MVYLIYSLVISTLLVFGITTSGSHLTQTLVNYFPKEAMFGVFSSLIIGFSFLKGNGSVKYVNKPVFAFVILVVVQFFLYFYLPTFDIKDNGSYGVNMWAVKPFINIMLGILLIKTLVENLSSKDWIRIFKFLCWCGFSVSVYALFQWVGIDPIGDNFEKNFVNDMFSRPQSMTTTLSHHTLTACFIALLAPLNLMFSEKRYKAFFLTSFVCLCLVDSILALGCFFVTFIIYLVFCKRFKVIACVFIVLVASLFFLNKTNTHFFSSSGRVAIWKNSVVDVLSHKPFRGFGHGSYAKKYSDKTIVLFAHNDYVQELNEGGIPGFVILMFFIYGLFYKCLYNIAQKFFIADIVILCTFIGLCLMCFGTFVFHYPPLAVIGILYISYIEHRNINIGRLT
jgi:hypothetical protein